MLRLGLLSGFLVLTSACDSGTPSVEASLASTQWALVSLPSMEAETTTTLDFDASGGLGGRAACNTYSGSYTALGGGVAGPRFAATVDTWTEAGCPGPLNAYEVAYWDLIRSATRWARDGDQLRLTVGVGAEIVFAERPTP